jgi:hypothetical protein
MKKLIYALPLLVLGGCQAVNDGVRYVEDAIKAPPTLVADAVKAIISFLVNLFSAGLDTIIHKMLPF